MNITTLNEELLSIINEDIVESKDFKTVLKEIMNRIETGVGTKEDLNVLKDFNASIIKNPELNAAIYQVILNADNTLVNKLINSLQGTSVYMNLVDNPISNDKLLTDLKELLGEETYQELLSKGKIFVANFYARNSYPYLTLYLENNKISLRYGSITNGKELYVGTSVDDCKKVIQDQLLNNKYKIFQIWDAFKPMIKDHQDRLRFQNI